MKDVPTGTNERPSPCTKPTAASLVLGLDSQPGLPITLFVLLVLACLGVRRGFGKKEIQTQQIGYSPNNEVVESRGK